MLHFYCEVIDYLLECFLLYQWKDMRKIPPLKYFHGITMALRSAALCRPFGAGHCNYVFVKVIVSLYLTDYLKEFLLLRPAEFALANLLALCKHADVT